MTPPVSDRPDLMAALHPLSQVPVGSVWNRGELADFEERAAGIEQARNPDGSPSAAHPAFKPHPMQGWTPDFIPKLTEDAVALELVDRVLTVSNAEALRGSRDLATKEGIFVGISSGANLIGAIQLQERLGGDATVVTVFPDSNKKYLSTDLMLEEPVRNHYLSPSVELTGFSVLPRVCSGCIDF